MNLINVLPLKNLVDWVTGKNRWEKNITTLKIYILKKESEIKKKNIFLSPHDYTFYKFPLKIETSWAKKVVKPILETRNGVC